MDPAPATWRVLYRPGDVVEVRAFLKRGGNHPAWDGWSSGIVFGYFDDPDAYAAALAALDASRRPESIYTTLNPVKPALLARSVNRLQGGRRGTDTATDEDITERRWLLIDCDPVRPAGISATNDEMMAAVETSVQIRQCLTDAGWPLPVVAASGNGVHLLYRVSLANDEQNKSLIADCLHALALRFDNDAVTVDSKVFNAARITKAYGTVTRKGDSTEDRPHRRSGISTVPDPINEVAPHLLEALADQYRQIKAQNDAARRTTTYVNGTGNDWTPADFLAEALRKASDGNRNATGFWLACQLRDQGYSEAEAGDTLRDYAASVPNPDTYSDGEALSSVRQAYSESAREPRGAKEWAEDEDQYDGFGPTPEPVLLSQSPAPPDEITLPYVNQDDGRMYYVEKRKDRKGREYPHYTPISNFQATITGQIEYESGEKIFQVGGKARRGEEFNVDVPAELFGDDRRLRALLEAAAGPQDGLLAGQAKHLSPAIKHLTVGDVPRRKRYQRTGWTGKQFLIPGREPDGIEIELHRKLPYALNGADVDEGMDALSNLLAAIPAEQSTVALSFVLSAPMAQISGWRNERYALFIAGRTGSYKTSWTQTMMCLYGAGFAADENLIKWGEGATRNAIMALAAGASDLPFLVDNYKPQTGRGQADFVNLIHNILEGGEKDRMNRAAQLRSARSIHCWPIFTGEDVPDNDAASLARVLVLEFNQPKPGINYQLSAAQDNSQHLSAVGWSWIEWLMTDEGSAAVKQETAELNTLRLGWAEHIASVNPKAQNIMRVATNLATNTICWRIARQHPVIGNMIDQLSEQHDTGLRTIAGSMASRTAGSLEAERYLFALRQLLSLGRYVLQPRSETIGQFERDRVIGYQDSEGIYLVPDVALAAALELLGRHGLNELTTNTLHSQLKSMGLIAGHNPGRLTRRLRMASTGRQDYYLHLVPEALDLGTSEDDLAESDVEYLNNLGL